MWSPKSYGSLLKIKNAFWIFLFYKRKPEQKKWCMNTIIHFHCNVKAFHMLRIFAYNSTLLLGVFPPSKIIPGPLIFLLSLLFFSANLALLLLFNPYGMNMCAHLFPFESRLELYYCTLYAAIRFIAPIMDCAEIHWTYENVAFCEYNRMFIKANNYENSTNNSNPFDRNGFLAHRCGCEQAGNQCIINIFLKTREHKI